MGIFGDGESENSRDEVRVNFSQKRDKTTSSGEGQLKSEVESKVGKSTSGSGRSSTTGSGTQDDTTLSDIKRQNEKIIELLEQLKSEETESEQEKRDNVGSGMNELL